jgi:hypothetical protein
MWEIGNVESTWVIIVYNFIDLVYTSVHHGGCHSYLL